jgi:hypothetical protein
MLAACDTSRYGVTVLDARKWVVVRAETLTASCPTF